MRKMYLVTVQRTVVQEMEVTRSGFDSEEVIEAIVDEVRDDSFYLGWTTTDTQDIEVKSIEVVYPDEERDE